MNDFNPDRKAQVRQRRRNQRGGDMTKIQAMFEGLEGDLRKAAGGADYMKDRMEDCEVCDERFHGNDITGFMRETSTGWRCFGHRKETAQELRTKAKKDHASR